MALKRGREFAFGVIAGRHDGSSLEREDVLGEVLLLLQKRHKLNLAAHGESMRHELSGLGRTRTMRSTGRGMLLRVIENSGDLQLSEHGSKYPDDAFVLVYPGDWVYIPPGVSARMVVGYTDGALVFVTVSVVDARA